MAGDVKAALKDLQADIISLKHETQTCIMDASMRKAILTESEKDVRADVGQIRVKLEAMLKAIESDAIMALNAVIKRERESINTEIVSLEDEHKSLEELEQYIKSKTSTISTKPLQEGREKCDLTKEALDRYREKAERRGAQFVLHPLLTAILEQIENFAMGEVILRAKMDEVVEEGDDVPKLTSEPTNASIDPSRITFMRSNSSKLIQLRPNNSNQANTSRQNSANANNPKQLNKDKPLSRQNSQNNKLTAAVSRRNSVSKDRPNISRQNSFQTSKDGKSTNVTAGIQTQQAKVLKRTLTNVSEKQPKGKQKPANTTDEETYRNIAGLRATITKRSATAPLINLTSPVKSTFAPISEELPAPVIHTKDTFDTLRHNNNCYITGIAIMQNSNIVVCDNVHDSLQLYNPEYQKISQLECLHPWGVTAVSENAVAVTLHYDHKVVLIKASENLERLNEKDILLKCNSSLCFDVKFYAFRLYVLCINSDIHVVDLKGREYNIIRTGISPNTLKYFDVDTNNETVLVSGENGIACVDYRGLPLWHYKVQSRGKMLPTGLIVLNGRIIFCDWANHCLNELYEDGQKIRTVFSETIEKPLAITASDNGDTIVFSEGDYNMDIDKSRIIRVLTVEPIDVSP